MSTRGHLAVIVLTATCLSCQVVIASDCDHTAPREATVPMEGARRVVIDAGAGSLEVRGVADRAELRATGTACASRDSVLEDIRLVADRRGDTVRLETRFPRNLRGSARLDLEVEVPSGVEVMVDDGSGPIVVRGVATVGVKDGSGSIEVSDVGGNVTVDDGSGDIELLGVGGDVSIDDGSGPIRLQGIGGSVRIDDGSGEIDVRDVDGEVRVEDGSGSIEIAGVGGSVIVEEDGSGDIVVADVRGDFIVENDGSGSVDYDRVDGRVSIDD